MLICEHLDLLVVPKITCMDWITSVIHIYIQYIHTYNTYTYTYTYIHIHIQYIYINYTNVNKTLQFTGRHWRRRTTRITRWGKVGVELLRSVGDIFDKTSRVQRLYMCFFSLRYSVHCSEWQSLLLKCVL